MPAFTIGDRLVGDDHPVYFIAEIGANHDGDLDRAKALIRLARDAGAQAAKFQNFTAEKIVSEAGTKAQGESAAHQSQWKKSVLEVYRDCETPPDWTPILKEACDAAGLDYLSTPYDRAAIDLLEPYMPAYKIGSGDLDWLEALACIAEKGKPVLLGTGAADIGQVQQAVQTILAVNPHLVLMQCNSNYTGSLDNFAHIHLRVLSTYRQLFPSVVLGLSDHTPGHATALGAVALGARVVEKHFTDDPRREGADHGFAMTPAAFKEMVDRVRELELALGSPLKQIADNEQDTWPLQRRCLRAAVPIAAGDTITRDKLDVLRPVAPGAIRPPDLDPVIGATATTDIAAGEALRWHLLRQE